MDIARGLLPALDFSMDDKEIKYERTKITTSDHAELDTLMLIPHDLEDKTTNVYPYS